MDLIKMKAYHIKDIAYFKIYKTRNKNYERQYIIWNTNYKFNEGHTHRFTIGECESIVQHILNKTNPKRISGWRDFNDLIVSYIRLAEDEVYINHLLNLVSNRNIVKSILDSNAG